MKSGGVIALLLLLGVSVFLNISTYLKEDPMQRFLTEKGTVILSPDVTEALLADLKSGDKVRMERWRSYLYLCAGLDTNFVVQSKGLSDTYELYKSRERPGRSNYFNRLVWDLKMKQPTSAVTKDDVVGFLGAPDFAVEQGRAGQLLQYAYSCSGMDCLASFVVSNNVVVRIDIGAR